MSTDDHLSRENDVVHYFKDAEGEWRWHRVAANNEIVSESGEGYESKEFMLAMAGELNPGIEIRPHEE